MSASALDEMSLGSGAIDGTAFQFSVGYAPLSILTAVFRCALSERGWDDQWPTPAANDGWNGCVSAHISLHKFDMLSRTKWERHARNGQGGCVSPDTKGRLSKQ